MEYIGFLLLLIIPLVGSWGILTRHHDRRMKEYKVSIERNRGACIGDGHGNVPRYAPGRGATRASRNKKSRKKRFKKNYPLDCWRRKYKRKRGRS